MLYKGDIMETKKLTFLIMLVVVGLSFQQGISLETTNYNVDYKSGWIRTNGNKYLEINIKDNESTTVNQSIYNLTVIIKRTGGSIITQYNQTLVAFPTNTSQFMIKFQTNYPLTLSYSIYLFKTSKFEAITQGSNHVQEITLVQSGSTISMSLIPLLLGLPTIFGFKKYNKRKK